VESAKRHRECVGILLSKHYWKWILVPNFLGVWGCPKRRLPKSANCFRIMVSAAGFEPATHALKGQHRSGPPIFFYNIHVARRARKSLFGANWPQVGPKFPYRRKLGAKLIIFAVHTLLDPGSRPVITAIKPILAKFL